MFVHDILNSILIIFLLEKVEKDATNLLTAISNEKSIIHNDTDIIITNLIYATKDIIITGAVIIKRSDLNNNGNKIPLIVSS